MQTELCKSGWIIIDKPVGMSSAKVVYKVRKLLGIKKAGHAGTLDPLATGVLPIGLGEATKVMKFAVGGRKEYIFTIKFGTATDTDDSEGEVIKTSAKLPTEKEIRDTLASFTGEIEQTPPSYSAIKVNGKRAYKLAREGIEVKIKSRIVEIGKLVLLSMPRTDEAEFIMECSKGTYVRSLARDLAEKLGTYGHIIQLRRTKVGIFSEKSAILLESLEKLVHGARPLEPDMGKVVLPVEAVLDDIPVLNLDQTFSQALRNGQAVFINHKPIESETICALNKGKLVAIGRMEGSLLKPVRVFNH